MQLKLRKLFLTTLTFFLVAVFNIVTANADLDPQYTYDQNGNRITVTDPTGIIRYEYNAVNQLTKITNPSNQVITFTYDTAGHRTGMTFPNGMTARYSYDNVNQLIALSYHLGNNTIASFSYAYDAVGNCTSMTDEYGEHTYTYDNLYRLTQTTHPQFYNPTETYTYDAVGNRNPATNVYNEANQLVQDADYVYLYNMNGNTLYRRDKTNLNRCTRYYWNAENQLTKIEEYSNLASGIITSVSKYIYDGDGRRVAKNVNNIITKYVYDEDDILLETDGNDKILVRYTYGTDIDEPLIMQRDTNGDGVVDTPYYYIADGLGNIVKLVNSSGNIVNSYAYNSFGNIVSKTEGVLNRYTYTGREYDAESGLYYYRTRYYNAKIGRFLSEDKIGFEGGINFYAYVENNPVNYIDPYGLQIVIDPYPYPTPDLYPYPLPISPYYPSNQITPRQWGEMKNFLGLFNPIPLYNYLKSSVSNSCSRPNSYEKRGHSDPSWTVNYTRVNPGRDANGNCNPCPPDSPIWEHIHKNGRMNKHQIQYRQNENTCECFPKRMHK